MLIYPRVNQHRCGKPILEKHDLLSWLGPKNRPHVHSIKLWSEIPLLSTNPTSIGCIIHGFIPVK